MDQLDILKQEMAILKQNLDKEQIINDKLMRTVMKQRASWLNTLVKVEFISMPFIWLVLVGGSMLFHISIWYANVFIILALLDTALDCRTMRIPPKIFSTYSMMEMRRFLVRQKKERLIQVWVATPLSIIWLFLYINAIRTGGAENIITSGAFVGGIIGLLIAVPVIIIIYRNAQNTNDSLLRDIDRDE